MDDQTLLARAAKAAGLRVNFHPTASYQWNPLSSDGDALRLAVACGISVIPYPIYSQPKHSVIAKRYEGGPAVYRGDAKPIEAFEIYGSDPYAATRRAIVRAAAEIGGE